ncbi:MAG: 2-phospho-L-lactate guanylyltransferase [Solirubrobacteraceae bacterium]
MRTAAILPVKSFARAKQRLGASVADPLRLALAAAMVADVLAALARTEAIEHTIVVTRQGDVARAARAQGATVLDDRAEDGQSVAAARAVAHALRERFDRVLCVPGDCPGLDPGELAALLEGGRGAEVVILPDRHGTGTNGLLLTPPDAIVPSFGPGSCERHRALALAAGLACRVQPVPSLALDVDTGADLAALRAALEGRGGLAANTRAVLGTERFASALSVASGS